MFELNIATCLNLITSCCMLMKNAVKTKHWLWEWPAANKLNKHIPLFLSISFVFIQFYLLLKGEAFTLAFSCPFKAMNSKNMLKSILKSMRTLSITSACACLVDMQVYMWTRTVHAQQLWLHLMICASFSRSGRAVSDLPNNLITGNRPEETQTYQLD